MLFTFPCLEISSLRTTPAKSPLHHVFCHRCTSSTSPIHQVPCLADLHTTRSFHVSRAHFGGPPQRYFRTSQHPRMPESFHSPNFFFGLFVFLSCCLFVLLSCCLVVLLSCWRERNPPARATCRAAFSQSGYFFILTFSRNFYFAAHTH